MKKLNILFLIPLIFLYSCGYESIHNKKQGNYSIIKFEAIGEKKISRNLTRYFTESQDVNDTNKYYEIKTNSKIEKEIESKNSRGVAENYSIKITIELVVKQNSEVIKKKTFVEKSNYSNTKNKFELKQYEEIIIEGLTDKIIDKINFFISSLK